MSTTTASGKIKYKLVFLGNQNVGKSSIIDKYINDKFDESSNPTVGIDFLAKNTIYKGKQFRLQLWDTAGQERFKSLIPSYLKDAVGAIIVYDVSNKQSLVDAQKWMKLYNENKSVEGYMILVGNKIDLPYREISCEEGKKVASQLLLEHFEMSAKTGQNVQALFEHIIDRLSEGKHTSHIEPMKQINEEKKEDETEVDTTVKKLTKQQPHNIVLNNSEPATTTTVRSQRCC